MLLVTLSACTALLDSSFEAAEGSGGGGGSAGGFGGGSGGGGSDAGPGEPVQEKIAPGAQHTCGLWSDGTIWCWGLGSVGRLGHGSSESSPTPVRVVAADGSGDEYWDDWIDVAAGGAHTCGIRLGGSLWCWGGGSVGQRGDGTFVETRPTPVLVLPSADEGGSAWSDWTGVTAGVAHTCALRSDRSLWCWGDGNHGRLGDEQTTFTDGTNRNTPWRVLAAEGAEAPWSDWVEVAGGHFFTCGRRDNGTLWCWGNQGSGKLGNGYWSAVNLGRPVQVLAADADPETPTWWNDWAEIEAGYDHACGRRSEGSLWCWGSRADGKLGDGYDGMNTNIRYTPARVLAEGDVGDPWIDWVEVTAGYRSTCGRRSDSSLWCWGSGLSGQLGDGTVDSETSTPRRVLEADALAGSTEAWSDWTAVETCHACTHVCGIRAGGTMWCWGNGAYEKRGDGLGEDGRSTPARVLDPASDGDGT